jgi:hypothetical protein
VAILSDIIINENLKLLKINYLAQEMDVFFNFPSRSRCTCNRTYGKTMYMATYLFWRVPLLIRLLGPKAPSPRIKVARTWNITFSHLYV